ncbi:DNA alkylation repair protein [Candidatus Berkelbacteria bacterium CG23_combo_of_CG06-09_8_20_14_all_33_15]|uniref:DNA alkylation repair protein n=1 Tax=Candidatus Berkelbacteria bacterium CG_4_10_14_0_2_um_filter_35_9_33_12 TaxID=1974499 RepID=A0A2M7W3X6_9BACT|nr:MAG: DNA alkylation repair protein [Candidatus Berkelbacteria bacterium CG23_combo_of_CG06-09_8_20_14_all_33_15]PJA20337.1 MAG: DNA alkylation repair protein [Candidatus Berkelbacteria bacterium CG_4_10_14_0_2_um_filter_35_9_33_12]
MAIIDELKLLANSMQAKNLQRFLKTGKGEYGEGDVSLGIKVPQIRSIVRKYWKETNLKVAEELLHSKYHEMRMCALLILVERYKKIASEREKIFRIYIASAKYINNWDLVDLTAPQIVGGYLADKPKTILYQFAKSKNLWERRIAILTTFNYIYQGESQETIKIARILLHDPHDLIHKAVGWMLREVGKRVDEKILTNFLDKRYKEMPRTMLRYAIEKLSEKKRKYYLSK